MNFKDMLSKISQLSEATKEKEGGRVHTADAGGYGRKDDEDSDGKKVKVDAPKKGRGRPKKDADASGEEKKYDTKSLGSVFGGGQKPKKEVGKVSKKHSLKEYFDQLEDALNEAEQIQIKPASQMPKLPGQTSVTGQKPAVAGQPQKNTQVIQQGNKVLGSVDNPQLAQQIKQSIGKGEMTLMPSEEMEEGLGDMARKVGGAVARRIGSVAKKVGGKALDTLGHGSDEDLIRQMQKRAGLPQTGKKPMATQNEGELPVHDGDKGAGLGAGRSQGVLEGKDEGKPGKNFAKIAKSAGEKYGSKEAGERVAGAVRNKLKAQGKLEEAKPDFLDLDNDNNKEESMAKAAQDAKKKKTKVKEGMEHRLKAAHHRGKAHALAKESYNCKYDDMEESRMYHEGYKEGLDECYGQMPVQGYVGEMGQSTVDDMASYGAHTPTMEDDMMEVGRGEWMKQKAKSTPGDTFNAFGQTMSDKDVLEADSVFESWDNQLGSLLEEYDTIQEGMTVSISKGQQGMPDSVSVTAQDGEADQLLQIIKQAGLGLFGGDDAGQSQQGQSSAMSLQPADGGEEGGEMEIGVVDDHDGMMDLIRKVTGGAGEPNTAAIGGSDEHDHDQEYEDEEGEACDTCGHSDCECDHEQVDEVESEDQQEYEVAEDNAPDSDAEETSADENAEASEDEALAKVDAAQDENQVNEWANEAGKRGTDEQFQTDISFMTKVIAGGLNKEKIDVAGNGQSTVPVTAVRVNESVNDWRKLAGIK